MKKTSLYLVITVCALLLATSCWRKQLLTVSRDRFLFDMNGGTIPFIVTADCDWHIEADESASWVTLSQTEGNFGANVSISVSSNPEQIERSTVLKIISFNGRASKKLYVQQKTDVNAGMLIGSLWFLRFYERWDLDYQNQIIDDSYRSWTYYIDEDYEDWFFYFTDTIGFLVYAYHNDTTYSPYHYVYYPANDSLYLNFVTTNDSVEDYYAHIHELSLERFTLSNEYKHNRFEKLYNVNISTAKSAFKINPDKIVNKKPGPLIPIK